MSVILGIDIGGSTTKIVGLHSDGSTIAMHRVQAQDPITSLYGALGNFLFTNQLALSDVSKIVLTGVGASYVEGDIYGIATESVEEFTAVGVGGLALSGQERAVVVSMGTGTAFIWAEKGAPVRHLCGSGVGGGTLAGLSAKLCGTRQWSQIVKLASEGDVNHIDLTVGDLTRNSHPSLPLDITAANFGNVSDTATAGDFAAGVVNMVLQSIGTTAVMACRACGCETVVATGFMSNLPQAETCFALFNRLHGVRFIIPEHATYATSIGAALCSFDEK
ncbi:MAG: pantothenate kinase [Oscillospiraceae bacterium]|nr:pantothenate kinase [Oscillospiraceae bacterium]MCI8878624.1 pantothenate kinase [Oscillospiraceae bacterium]